jgi:hypothetical protein
MLETDHKGGAMRSKQSKKSTGGLTIGPVALIAGLWMKSHFGPVNTLCNTGLGAFGQAVSSTAAHECALYGAAFSFGEVLVWMGAISTVMGILAVIAVLGQRRGDTRAAGEHRLAR